MLMVVEVGSYDFKFMMLGLERGLQVVHITTPADQLQCCQHDEEIEVVLNRSDLLQFDQIPVQEQGVIIGLVRKLTVPSSAKGLAREHMQPLGESILVSADAPLLEYILNSTLDRLVIRGTKIHGLVTRSDLLKLPVTLLGFALVTHIEVVMLTMIRDIGISKQVWWKYLGPESKKDIRKFYNRLTDKRSDPDPLELTTFADKRTILEHLATEETYASRLPDKESINQLEEIRKFRNTIAHTGGKVDSPDTIQELIDRLRLTQNWIERWQTEQ
jgi:hypothetical protein